MASSPYDRQISQAAWAPVYLVDDGDFKTPEPGKAHSDVSVYFAKSSDVSGGWNSSGNPKSLSASDWIEYGQGRYAVKFSATDHNTLGDFNYHVVCSGCLSYPGYLRITNNTDDGASVNSHTTAAKGEIQAECEDAIDAKSLATATALQTVDDNVDSIKTKTDNLEFSGTDVKATLDGETVITGDVLGPVQGKMGMYYYRIVPTARNAANKMTAGEKRIYYTSGAFAADDPPGAGTPDLITYIEITWSDETTDGYVTLIEEHK